MATELDVVSLLNGVLHPWDINTLPSIFNRNGLAILPANSSVFPIGFRKSITKIQIGFTNKVTTKCNWNIHYTTLANITYDILPLNFLFNHSLHDTHLALSKHVNLHDVGITKFNNVIKQEFNDISYVGFVFNIHDLIPYSVL